MGNKRVKWCFGLKDGLRIVEPSKRLARSYLEESKLSLKRAQKNFEDGDLLWTTVVIYYAEYYAAYAFLQRIGVKCENHACSILAVEHLLGKNNARIIQEHQKKRIDAQYYMRTGKEKDVQGMLFDAKVFISTFDDIISKISQKEVMTYRRTIQKEK